MAFYTLYLQYDKQNEDAFFFYKNIVDNIILKYIYELKKDDQEDYRQNIYYYLQECLIKKKIAFDYDECIKSFNNENNSLAKTFIKTINSQDKTVTSSSILEEYADYVFKIKFISYFDSVCKNCIINLKNKNKKVIINSEIVEKKINKITSNDDLCFPISFTSQEKEIITLIFNDVSIRKLPFILKRTEYSIRQILKDIKEKILNN